MSMMKFTSRCILTSSILIRSSSARTKSVSSIFSFDMFSKRRLSTSEKYVEDAIGMAKKFGFSEFECILTTGGDDRSLILETGANKYHIKPQPIEDSQIFRGSCTGNPPTRRGYSAARKLYEEKLKGLQGEDLEKALRDTFQDQRTRLAKCLQLPEGSEVILCPSGSDAEYIPIAISRALTSRKIVNGVTQLNEIGAGSAPASTGKHFSKYAPFLGDHGLDSLSGFEDVDGIVIRARETDGSVIDASGSMADFAEEQISLGNYPIVHGVFGGKTGVRDETMPKSLEAGDQSMGVVDACQGRFTLEELNDWLTQHSLVLFTASKFYQAPPFCGAVILPASIAKKVSNASPPIDMLGRNGLLGFVTEKELPFCLEHWKKYLEGRGRDNVGLACRWEAGLSAMETLSSIPDIERTVLTDEWASSVKQIVEANEMLDTFCVERSIVSIRMKKHDNAWLNMSEARDLFRWMSMDVSDAVPDATEDEKAALSTPAFIGQPVSVTSNFAIVRIALGVDSLLSYKSDKESTLKEDKLAVTKLGAIARHFDALKSSSI